MVEKANFLDLTRVQQNTNSSSKVTNPIKSNNDSDVSIFSRKSTDKIDPEENFNSLFKYQEVVDKVDLNGDGKVDDTEKQAFIEEIKGLDGDDTSVSNEDISKALEQIMKEKEETEKALSDEATPTKANEQKDAQKASSTPKTAKAESPKQTEKNAQNLNDMSMKELQEERANRSAKLDEANKRLEDAQKNYDEKVKQDAELKEELKTKQEENQKAIDAKQQEISGIQSNITSLEGQKITEMPPQTITDEEGNEQPNPEYEQAVETNNQIDEQVKELEQQLEEKEQELDELEQKRAEIEAEIMESDCSEETKQALQELNDADIAQHEAQDALYEVDRAIAAKEAEGEEE